ncbi:MAG: hypothetical protein LUD17_14690 [Bacteroidales bacterium]|nr:hypothetical protein [Bacteroidales bacterium]
MTTASPSHSSRMQLRCALALVAMGCALLIAAFVVPPEGEIHSSVLVAFGEILTFAGALFGIDYRYRHRP